MSTTPGATYRLQLNPDFTFHDARSIVDYLAELGITHVYLSPYLQAVPGSAHGYDVVDPHRVNEDLGGTQAHAEFCEKLSEHGLGHVLDVVPNHMAISGPENAWWWDVLENGPSSPYAEYFDVDWEPSEHQSSNIIPLPILGERYGRCLDAGEITLSHNNGRFFIEYYEHWFPVAPRSLGGVFERIARRSRSEETAFLADCLRQLPLPTVSDRFSTRRRDRNKKQILRRFTALTTERPDVKEAVETVVEEINASPDQLDALLEEQNYRLVYWRTALHDLGYRRFFDINTLVGLRIEEDAVFEDTHRLILKWLKDGTLDGVRIDHPDGLRDPQGYLHRLRSTAPEAWLVVEKILHPGEGLPSQWPVDGTTGYDFLNTVGSLFVCRDGESDISEFYTSFTGLSVDFPSVARDKKHQVMTDLLAGDVSRLTVLLGRVCEQLRHYRDYTRDELNEALREVIACFPVYRSYVNADTGQIRDQDRRIVSETIQCAKSFRPDLDPALFDLLESLILLETRGDAASEFVMRFQQLTGPVAAKGIEDTAFYCFNRLICLNEVGGDPGRFGLSVERFHEWMRHAAESRPHSMLATSTHDTKRSEDVRLRIALLSEIPEEWSKTVRRWSAHNEKLRSDDIPDRNAEYLFYQTLVGAWPIETERMVGYMEKAGREAKAHTSWTQQNDAYERGVRSFVEAVMSDSDFRADLERFIAPLIEAGRVGSLSQTLIKLTAPGVPDFYQGTELWDLSLVDPDNRRPVDFELRRRLLQEVQSMTPEDILARSDEGLSKLMVISRSLRLRNESPGVFSSGEYEPLQAWGSKARHVVAFSRDHEIVTVAPRLLMTLQGEWDDTWIRLAAGEWRNEMTGDRVQGGKIMLSELLKRFPVALLVRER